MPDDAELIARYLEQRDTPCPACGFNLRGVRDATCPECGRRLGLSMLLLHEQHALPLAARRSTDARWRLRVIGLSLLSIGVAVGLLSFPSARGAIVGLGFAAGAIASETTHQWYRRRLARTAMYENALTRAIDRLALPASVVLAVPGALAAMSIVARLLVLTVGL